jgi:hypothetical protein
VTFVFAGFSALVFFNVWRAGASYAARSSNKTVATIGTAAGALTHFGS